MFDLNSIDHENVIRNQEKNRIRLKLSKMTVSRLRAFARSNHISLGGESSKQGIITEIMGQYGHQWKLKEEEIV